MLNFFNIPIPLLTTANFSFECSLKFSFPSSLSPRCFRVLTFSTTRLLKCKSGCCEECDFLKNITSWVCFVGSGLTTIFNCSAHLWIFLKSLFGTFAVFKKDHRSLKIKRYHQSIVLHCCLNCVLGHYNIYEKIMVLKLNPVTHLLE